VKNCENNKKKNRENVQTKKNCDRAFLSPKSQFYIIQTDPKPLSSSQTKKKNPHSSVTKTVASDRKIRTALRTNQIVAFVTVHGWIK